MNDLLNAKLKEVCKAGISDEICRKISDYIRDSEIPRLFRVSPYRLADEWNLSRSDVLKGFLYATKTGIFDLEWDIKCPSCKGSTSPTQTLSMLTSTSHCNYCRIDINGGLDDAVEITFHINQNIKTTGDVPFFEVMKAWMKINAPVTLSAGPRESQEIKLNLESGTYHMFNETFTLASPLLVKPETAVNKRTIEFIYDGNILQRTDTNWYSAGPFSIKLINDSMEDMRFTFARAGDFPWVSGADLATNQFFRDYFSTELISADETFAVRNMVFVFTDIKSSTDLYERRGDSTAYYLVKEHFKIMAAIVERNNGAIVKTIGDAIMATFLVSSDAVKAVFEMHEEFAEFNKKERSRDDIIIKIGVHRGPCIAVTSNDKLDYFGRTVNIAARVQGLSGGNDVMISNELYNETGIDDLIETYGWDKKKIQAELKGIAGFYDVIHLYR